MDIKELIKENIKKIAELNIKLIERVYNGNFDVELIKQIRENAQVLVSNDIESYL